MANCQISPLSDQCGPSRSSEEIPEGRVGQVCKEWLIREDGNLAYRLQNEEISHHYESNRSKNRIAREDLPLAKHLQQNELLEARRLRSRYIPEQTETDEKVAKQIERRLRLEDEMARKATEEADERLAKKLMEKEKARQLRKRLEKEKQQVERVSAQIGADYPPVDLADQSEQFDLTHPPNYQRILTEDEQELDLSEFCMPPPPGLTPEELKLFLEEQDAEIARLLQQQELKRNRNLEKEKQAVIEAQDFEIARMLQKMEKERARRIKERFRAKQQNHQEERFQIGIDEPGCSHFQRTSTPITPQTSLEESQIREVVENEYDIPENHLGQEAEAESTYEEPYQVIEDDPRPRQNFYNIAIDLDPTYQRRQQRPSQSPLNLVESCVDDEEDEPSESQSPPDNRLGLLTRSHDSLERLHRCGGSNGAHPVTSTSSSRSSLGSSSSHRSKLSQSRYSPAVLPSDDDYAPPLPPRDVSLLYRSRMAESDSVSGPIVHLNQYLPPHHPQHPNRRTSQQGSESPERHSPNRSSLYAQSSSSNLPIPGQRRVSSMEKQKKSKHKHQEGCRTQ